MVLDTGCTGHYLTIAAPHTNLTAATPGITVLLPDGSTITSTHTAELAIPGLPLSARQAHIFPTLASGSLISVGVLCDHGCTATFSDSTVSIHLPNGDTILTGTRSAITQLWCLNLPSTPAPSAASTTHPPSPLLDVANSLLQSSATIASRVAYYHATMFSPAQSTWCAAIDAGHFTSWPELTSAQVRRHPPRSAATIKGHLDQQRANLRSTSAPSTPPLPSPPPASTIADPAADDHTPPSLQSQRSHELFAHCAPITGQLFSDLTGRFVQPSCSGNTDMLVLYDYDSNFIHVEPMKSKSGPEILAAYQRAHALLTSRGLRPLLQRLDNEASAALQSFMADNAIDFQLAPPHVHRRNAAERAIRTFKNHFIAGLCSTDPSFPLNLWDRLLPQAIQTLNLLRTSRINPQLSAWAQVHGLFDFNRTPLAPPGTRVLIHEKPAVRSTWAPHAVDGWYLGPATRHYRCYRVWVTETSAERIVDTLSWFPTHVTMPAISPAEAATAAAIDLIHALQATPTSSTPLSLRADHHHALQQLATIFASPSAPVTAEPLPLPTALPSATVRFAPVPTAPPALPRVELQPTSPAPGTFAAATGNAGQRRRRRKKAALTDSTPPAIPDSPQTPDALPASETPLIPDSPSLPLPPLNPHRTRSRGSANTCCVIVNAPTPADLPRTTAAINAVVTPSNGAPLDYTQLLRGPDALAWIQATTNEIGRLTQGAAPHSTSGSETMFFIPHHAKPADRTATYLRIVAAIKPHKAESKRIRFTVGGNRITYDGNVSTPTADLTTVKTLLNSVLSTPQARFMTIDIKDFYLNTPMARFEYMRIPTKFIPPAISEQYNLAPLVHHDHVMVEIRKGMYGLPQAGILANQRLVAHLLRHGYCATPNTPGLFHHTTRPITFSLVVDDFGVKYVGKHNAEHLIDTLRQLYTITTEWDGTLYCGLTLAWNYTTRHVDVSMPGYIARALARFNHIPATRAQHAPHAWIPPSYGATLQLTTPIDTSAPLLPAARTRLQEIVGTLLYYARAVDSTMLVALGTLASAQTKGTEATATAVTQLLNYCATHPDATLRYHSSAMILHVHSDASYLSERNARSRAGGIFFLSDPPLLPSTSPLPDAPPPPLNGAIHVHSSIMSVVLSSATEAELGALFFNGKEAAMLRTTLHDMGHPQPATPIQTDNACAAGITNGTVKQRRSKAMDMRFYWMRNRVKQGQFFLHWRRGTDNLADYFTKHYLPAHHQYIRSR